MIITATAGFFVGAMIGLRFNVKMLAQCSLLIIVVCGVVAMTGLAFVTTAALCGLASVASLQIGYFVTLFLAAMGHMDNPAERPAQNVAGPEATDMLPPAQYNKPR